MRHCRIAWRQRQRARPCVPPKPRRPTGAARRCAGPCSCPGSAHGTHLDAGAAPLLSGLRWRRVRRKSGGRGWQGLGRPPPAPPLPPAPPPPRPAPAPTPRPKQPPAGQQAAGSPRPVAVSPQSGWRSAGSSGGTAAEQVHVAGHARGRREARRPGHHRGGVRTRQRHGTSAAAAARHQLRCRVRRQRTSFIISSSTRARRLLALLLQVLLHFAQLLQWV